MARCISCHLERQLGPLPVPGASSLGEQVCPRCSKDIDRSLGVLGIFGIDVLLPVPDPGSSESTEAKEKPRSGKKTPDQG